MPISCKNDLLETQLHHLQANKLATRKTAAHGSTLEPASDSRAHALSSDTSSVSARHIQPTRVRKIQVLTEDQHFSRQKPIASGFGYRTPTSSPRTYLVALHLRYKMHPLAGLQTSYTPRKRWRCIPDPKKSLSRWFFGLQPDKVVGNRFYHTDQHAKGMSFERLLSAHWWTLSHDIPCFTEFEIDGGLCR